MSRLEERKRALLALQPPPHTHSGAASPVPAVALVLDVDGTLLYEVDRRHATHPLTHALHYTLDEYNRETFRKELERPASCKHFELHEPDGDHPHGRVTSYVVARPAAAAMLDRLAPHIASGAVRLAISSANFVGRTACVVATLPLRAGGTGATLAARGAVVVDRAAALPRGFPQKSLRGIRADLGLSDTMSRLVMVDDRPDFIYADVAPAPLLQQGAATSSKANCAGVWEGSAFVPGDGGAAAVHVGEWDMHGNLVIGCAPFGTTSIQEMFVAQVASGGCGDVRSGGSDEKFWRSVEAIVLDALACGETAGTAAAAAAAAAAGGEGGGGGGGAAPGVWRKGRRTKVRGHQRPKPPAELVAARVDLAALQAASTDALQAGLAVLHEHLDALVLSKSTPVNADASQGIILLEGKVTALVKWLPGKWHQAHFTRIRRRAKHGLQQAGGSDGAATVGGRGTKRRAAGELRVHEAIKALPLSPLLAPGVEGRTAYAAMVERLMQLMTGWVSSLAGDSRCASFYDKRSFVHEMEEVIVPLAAVVEALEAEVAAAAAAERPIRQLTVVDLCAGKGFLPFCVAELVRVEPLFQGLAQVVLVELAELNWSHFHEHLTVAASTTADAGTAVCGGAAQRAFTVEIWSGCNMYEESTLKRVAALPHQSLLVGTHLCKRLSARAVEIFNCTAQQSRLLVLAPCCLPPFRGCLEIAQTAPSSPAKIDLVDLGATPAPFSAWVDMLLAALTAPATSRRVDVELRSEDRVQHDLAIAAANPHNKVLGRRMSWIISTHDELML